jgi:endonuclease YncB( thermonuclease family)
MNLYLELVKQGWCWWYRKYAPGDTMLEGLEHEARAGRKGLWTDPQQVPPWDGGSENRVSRQTLLLGVAALGVSLRRSQWHQNHWPK